jgi:hypothetical protein
VNDNERTTGVTRTRRGWCLRAAAGAVVAALALAATTGAGASTQTALLPDDPHALNLFGVSIAVSGTTALVGATTANGGTGAVYVFVKGPSGWKQQARLLAADAAPQANFGESVAIDGDTAVVGAPNTGILGGIGSAYVFERSGTTWTQKAELTAQCATCGGNGDFFGFSVAVSGTTALVGAPGIGFNQGAAFELDRSRRGVWHQRSMLTGSDSQPSDSFGWSVALSGDTALIGAPRNSPVFPGSAYVFARSGRRLAQQAELAGSDSENGDLFGRSVALSGDTALVGAPGCCAFNDLGEFRGVADVFVRSGSTWTSQAELTASDGVGGLAGDLFGSSVALLGGTAVVGAPGKNDTTGEAYSFLRSGTSWSEAARLLAPDGARNDRFGGSVGIAPGTALVGAPQHDGFRGKVDLFGP